MLKTTQATTVAERARDLLLGVQSTNPKPVLLCGGSDADRAATAAALADLVGIEIVGLGEALSVELRMLDHSPRPQEVLQCLARIVPPHGPVVLGKIEILFSPAVPINAIDALIRMSKLRPTCVVWPGRVQGNRLRYAQQDHSECLDEDANRVTVLDVTK